MQKGPEPNSMAESWHGAAHSSCFYKGSAALDRSNRGRTGDGGDLICRSDIIFCTTLTPIQSLYSLKCNHTVNRKYSEIIAYMTVAWIFFLFLWKQMLSFKHRERTFVWFGFLTLHVFVFIISTVMLMFSVKIFLILSKKYFYILYIESFFYNCVGKVWIWSIWFINVSWNDP